MVLLARKKLGTAAEKAAISHHSNGDENSGQRLQRGELWVGESREAPQLFPVNFKRGILGVTKFYPKSWLCHFLIV